MTDSPKKISVIQNNGIKFILTSVLIASGVNLIISGIINHNLYSNSTLYILAGLITLLASAIFLLYIDFKKSSINNITDAFIVYDPKNKILIDISHYDFLRKLNMYLKGGCVEDSKIKHMWEKDELFNFKYESDKCWLLESTSKDIFEQLLEYTLLSKLSMCTTDFFNNSTSEKISTLTRDEIFKAFPNNNFLHLFLNLPKNRKKFEPLESNTDGNLLFCKSSDGAIYEKLEIRLPSGCKLYKKSKTSFEIKNKIVNVTITWDCPGTCKNTPENFLKYYVGNEEVKCYNIDVTTKVKFSFKSLLLVKHEYVEWINYFIDEINNMASYDAFIKKIKWGYVETILTVSKNRKIN